MSRKQGPVRDATSRERKDVAKRHRREDAAGLRHTERGNPLNCKEETP